MLVAILLRACFVLLWTLGSVEGTQKNLALYKPAWQRQPRDPDSHALRATDGIYPSSCAVCLHTTDNWLTVDLLYTYTIDAIRLMNNPDGATKLTDFFIYVTSARPHTIPLSDNTLPGELCLHYPGTLPHNSIQELTCDNSPQPMKGRYVYVWKPENGQLTFCELEVLVTVDYFKHAHTELLYKGQRSNLSPIYTAVLDGNQTMSYIRCFTICMMLPEKTVTHFQINKRANKCECILFSRLTTPSLYLKIDEEMELWIMKDLVETN